MSSPPRLFRAWQRICLYAAAVIFLVSTPHVLRADQIPSTLRSINIVAKVEPHLLRDMDSMGSHFGAPIFIRIFKKEETLEVWVQVSGGFELFKAYFICDSSDEPGPKERAGDCKSPEGFYTVTPDLLNPNSNFHLSFDVGYPNAYDVAQGRTGSKVMVHGSCFSKGCFAMTDRKMEEIYALVDGAFRNGQTQIPVHIFPFRMTDENIARFHNPKWVPFWSNLKEGYDFFEKENRPPRVTVNGDRYTFE